MALATLSLLHGDESASSGIQSQGEVEAISDWALAGVVWSEANLVRKLAIETARSGDIPQDQMDELKAVAKRSINLIESMEDFGWSRLAKRDGSQARAKNDGGTSSGGVPDPKQAGADLAKELGLKSAGTKDGNRKQVKRATDSATLKRFDTETPARTDDPGLDDERTENRINVDIDQYRVDDYVDERPREAANRADAIEDGVEAAIAAASDDGIAGPVAGRISMREGQTLSATLPYAKDSIYDADDYDPDVDYDVDHQLTQREVNTEDAELPPLDDDISLRKPPIAATGEDELIAAMKRGGTADSERRSNVTSSLSPIDRYTDETDFPSADANWVQFQLNLNQNRWFAAKQSGLSPELVREAMKRLETTMLTTRAATGSKRLRNALR